jgi:hypothetical protein
MHKSFCIISQKKGAATQKAQDIVRLEAIRLPNAQFF